TGLLDCTDVYVSQQIRAANSSGVRLRRVILPSTTPIEELAHQISELNEDPSVHGITVQLPIGLEGMNRDLVLSKINPIKDVDGYLLWEQCPLLVHIPCAAAACLLLLQETGPVPSGLRCVVIGRGRLIGTPVASLMVRSANATTTICHTGTRCLEEEVNRAEIIISGVGKAHLIKGHWIRTGAIVIDCGIDASSGKVLGDVDFGEAVNRAGWITPVPGGVGPLTVALLMRNTLNAAKRYHSIPVHPPLMKPTGILSQ
ncbi:unnamed protein product, partial [Hydatigera taeniaeformis]|uniref:Methenyltetrahydrofolate cyclohydrolase n=1 Tax=Hydatigena taeniaeformis TaxID=6205 RepID=A0A0R3X8B9_HYDTA